MKRPIIPTFTMNMTAKEIFISAAVIIGVIAVTAYCFRWIIISFLAQGPGVGGGGADSEPGGGSDGNAISHSHHSTSDDSSGSASGGDGGESGGAD